MARSAPASPRPASGAPSRARRSSGWPASGAACPFDADSLTEDYELGLQDRRRRRPVALPSDPGGGRDPRRHPRIFPRHAARRGRPEGAVDDRDRPGRLGPARLARRARRALDAAARPPVAARRLAAVRRLSGAGPVAGAEGPGRRDRRRPGAAAGGAVAPRRRQQALLGWRLAIRAGFTAAAHGWREGLRAVPRAAIGNGVRCSPPAPRSAATGRCGAAAARAGARPPTSSRRRRRPMSRSPPLRFLVLLLAGWTGAPGGLAGAGLVELAGRSRRAADPHRRLDPRSQQRGPQPRPRSGRRRRPQGPGSRSAPVTAVASAARPRRAPPPAPPPWQPLPGASRRDRAAAASPRRFPPRRRASARRPPRPRWSFAAWSFLRRGDSAPLAAGGCSAAARPAPGPLPPQPRPAARPLALALRLSAPLRRPAGAEAALGPRLAAVAAPPVHLLAERRQALGRRRPLGLRPHPLRRRRATPRSALCGSTLMPRPGSSALRSLDLFGDGAARLSLPLAGNVRLGAGAWAAAQPGPRPASTSAPRPRSACRSAGRNVTLAADWRLRVAGNARPGLGPDADARDRFLGYNELFLLSEQMIL